jgi:hypothetical protein
MAAACEWIAGVHDDSYQMGSGGAPIGDDGGTGATATGATGGADGGPKVSDASCDGYVGPMPGPAAGPVILVKPADYLPYCSVSWPGGATLAWGSAPGDDPCARVLATTPCAKIDRAGLYAVSPGENNVLEHCGTYVKVYRDVGIAPMQAAIADAFALPGGAAGCVFTVAPVALPIFSLPYGLTPGHGYTDPSEDVDHEGFQVFNFDYYNQPVDVGQFGQTPFPSETWACAVDRNGVEVAYCGSCGGRLNCPMPSGPRRSGISYQWQTTQGKPVLAVAPGVVVTSWDRDVSMFCNTTTRQKEIYVEHRVRTSDPFVDASTYEERFVVGYRGLAEREVETHDIVVQGQEIAKTGNSGCVDDFTLRLLTIRETNLTGARAYQFQSDPTTYQGFNGNQGAINPFGWGAPQGIDPWAWLFIGCTDACNAAPGVTDTGAFSINLFIPGQAPPHE